MSLLDDMKAAGVTKSQSGAASSSLLDRMKGAGVSGKDPVGKALSDTHEEVALTKAQHNSRLKQLLDEQAATKQKKSPSPFTDPIGALYNKIDQNFSTSLGETMVKAGEEIAKPFTRTGATIEQGLMRPLIGKKPDTTEEAAQLPEMIKPYDKKLDAAGGAVQIGLTLAPEAAEVKALLGSANAYLKERTLLGLGAPRVGTKAAEEAATGLAGKVLQPKTTEAAAKSAEGLKLIDTTGVKTHQEAVKKGEEVITKMAEAVDKRLAADPTPRLPNTLKGEDPLYIKAALNDMGSVYSKTRSSAADVQRINALLQKFENEGLTAKEINDIAREYGTTFRNKAFKTDGTPATSWAGEGYENTRTAVKGAARNLMPDETTKALDEAMSKVYATNDHFSALADEAMRLKNKTIPANVVQKILSTLGKPVVKLSKATGLTDLLRDIVGASSAGSEKLSAEMLEKSLAKDLARIRKLQGLEGKNLADELIQMAEEAASKQAAAHNAMPRLPEAHPPGSPENPIIGSVTGLTPEKPPTGSLATEPPPDASGPSKPEFMGTEAHVKAINNLLGKFGVAKDFPLESTNLMQKDGVYYIVKSGYPPSRITPLEAMFFEQGGYKFTKPPLQ